jgi:hypothetical protein
MPGAPKDADIFTVAIICSYIVGCFFIPTVATIGLKLECIDAFLLARMELSRFFCV